MPLYSSLGHASRLIPLSFACFFIVIVGLAISRLCAFPGRDPRRRSWRCRRRRITSVGWLLRHASVRRSTSVGWLLVAAIGWLLLVIRLSISRLLWLLVATIGRCSAIVASLWLSVGIRLSVCAASLRMRGFVRRKTMDNGKKQC